jgi:hypothetical protein
MKYLTNNFSLNMVEAEEYNLEIKSIPKRQFKVECKAAKNRLSQLDISQELDLLPHPGNVAADIGDEIFVAQYKDGKLTFRKIIVGDIQ